MKFPVSQKQRRKKMVMEVPLRFALFAQTINVVGRDTLLMDEGAAAKVYPDKNMIAIQPTSHAYQIPEQQQIHNFYHELMHLLFISAGFEDDYADEHKVDLMAGMLHQALKTMEFKK